MFGYSSVVSIIKVGFLYILSFIVNFECPSEEVYILFDLIDYWCDSYCLISCRKMFKKCKVLLSSKFCVINNFDF